MPRKRTVDIVIGQRFERLVIRKELPRTNQTYRNKRYFLCECDCGNFSRVELSNLRSGGVKSCGCYKRDMTSARATTHGQSKTLTYKAFCEMKRRCQNPNSNRFKHYGGRGITVCDRWQSYENFIVDMGERPTPKHEIERIHNDDGYWCGHCDECSRLRRPANCKWATRQEQMNNTRANVYFEIDGRRQTISDWAREYGHPSYRVRLRLRRGWSITEALETPNDSSPGRHNTRRRHQSQQV